MDITPEQVEEILRDPSKLAKLREDAQNHPDAIVRIENLKNGMAVWTVLLNRAFQMARDQGLTLQEIADSLGISHQAVQQRLKRNERLEVRAQ